MGWYAETLDTPQSRTKAYYGVDLMKFICALMVLMIHCSPLADIEEKTKLPLYEGCLRLAVPFFFISAGYFLFRKITPDRFDTAPCWDYIKRLIRIYLLWTAFYFPLSWWNNIRLSENSPLHSALWYAKAVLLVNGGYGTLWYLHALIVSMLLMTFCFKRKMGIRSILLLSGAFFLFGRIGEGIPAIWRPLQEIPQLWQLIKQVKHLLLPTEYPTALFFGFFLTALGASLACCPIRISRRGAILGFLVFFSLWMGEAAFAENPTFFLAPATFFLFYLAAHLELPPHPAWRYLRDMSALLYYLHPAVLKWGEILHVHIPSSILRYLAALLVTMALAHLLLTLSRRKGWTWLAGFYR